MLEFIKDAFLILLGFSISELSSYFKKKRDKGPKPLINVKVKTKFSGATSPESNVREFFYTGEVIISNDSDYFAHALVIQFKTDKWNEFYDSKGAIFSPVHEIGSIHPKQTVILYGKESIRYADRNLPGGEFLMPEHFKKVYIIYNYKNDKGTLFKGEYRSKDL